MDKARKKIDIRHIIAKENRQHIYRQSEEENRKIIQIACQYGISIYIQIK